MREKEVVAIGNEIYQLLESGCSIPANGDIHARLKKALLFTEKKPKKKSKAKPVLTEEQEMELPNRIGEYNNIFPEKTKIPTSGQFARSAPRELVDGFRWFLLNNPQYTWDIILQATQMYVDQKRADKWEFMQTSQYFVRKQNIDKTWKSNLANYCQQVLDGGEEYKTNYNDRPTEKVV